MPSQPIKGPLLPLVQRDPLLPHSTVPLLLNIPLQITYDSFHIICIFRETFQLQLINVGTESKSALSK